MSIGKVSKRAAVAALAGAVAVVAYYAAVIHAARSYTVDTVLPREKAAEYPLALSSLTQRVVSGEYQPRGLGDLYYGALDAETQRHLPAWSYFKSYYE